ncbi:MAG: AMP-binding protein [Geminicoccaceae bacterium]
MNVAQLFARNAARAGELPALALGARTVATHATLARRAAAIAGTLRDGLRLAAGDRVALAAPNRPDYVELMAACWWAGLAVVPVNVKLHPAEIAWILEHSGARAAFVAESVASALPEIAGLERIVVIGSADAERLARGERMPVAEASPGDLAWVFYTSGTTGRPKGAMITHGNLLAMTAAFLADVEPIACGDAILHAAPLSHGSGLYVLPHAARAACQVVPESGGFDEPEVVATLASWPGTRMFAAPTIVRRLARHVAECGAEVANLAALIYGGAPMYLADLDAAHAALGFRLAQIYGQGESPMTITALDRRLHADRSHPRWRERLASVGTAQLGMEVRIADPDGVALATGEIGEVMARGPAVVPGYWREPEATARTMVGGWLRTGDIGCLDEDGFLYLKDRSKDVVISGGMNIYPREVEEALLTRPGVREIAVLGLPDPEWGERVVACVVAAPGIAPAELDAWCLARLARFKRPRDYHFLETLPKNAYGKVLKRELRDRLVGKGETP